jgi:dTDP-4-dehydrorhamnose 3,5-epimerase
VAVDIRKKSPTFGKYVAVELSDENKRQFFIPKGFAHGFAVLSEEAVFQYKCDEYYNPQSEEGIAWNDIVIGIDWQLSERDILLSDKDKNNLLLKDIEGI